MSTEEQVEIAVNDAIDKLSSNSIIKMLVTDIVHDALVKAKDAV